MRFGDASHGARSQCVRRARQPDSPGGRRRCDCEAFSWRKFLLRCLFSLFLLPLLYVPPFSFSASHVLLCSLITRTYVPPFFVFSVIIMRYGSIFLSCAPSISLPTEHASHCRSFFSQKCGKGSVVSIYLSMSGGRAVFGKSFPSLTRYIITGVTIFHLGVLFYFLLRGKLLPLVNGYPFTRMAD